MGIEEQEPNSPSDHILDWLEDSVTFLPSFFDDPYADEINGYPWLDQAQGLNQDHRNDHLIDNPIISTSFTSTVSHAISSPAPSDSPRKRKNSGDPLPVEVMTVRKTVGGKKGASSKGTTGNHNSNNKNSSGNGSKEGRWAEQLLNPCAAAICVGNLTRAQHLIYVLHELASATGDANHRLASHGLRALTHHLSSAAVGPTTTFASTEPRFFQHSLLRFYEDSPWFSFPNKIANASILQILNDESNSQRNNNLHILDIGVSHGVQWPTLLEALTRQSGGPPPLVRLTIIAATVQSDDQNTESTPFSIGPFGDDFSSRLLRYSKSIYLNLHINRIDNHPLQSLNSEVIKTSADETLIVCTQFRLHQLSHTNPDERTEFLKVLRSLEPKAVILVENNMDCSCNNCGDFAVGFSRRVEYLWRFLDSASSAYKGRESDERRVIEGEAAKALTSRNEMNEGKEKWCERMRRIGFVGEGFGEEAIDGGRALLRKYDGNWEMRVEEGDGFVGLWWKGQPVSFCSLWKLDMVAKAVNSL